MSTRVRASSVSTCASPGNLGSARSRGHFVLAGERAQGFGLHASSGIGGLLFFYGKVCARICPGFRRSEDLGRRGASPGGATPDEVVRILGFLEGEHRFGSPSFCMERAVDQL